MVVLVLRRCFAELCESMGLFKRQGYIDIVAKSCAAEGLDKPYTETLLQWIFYNCLRVATCQAIFKKDQLLLWEEGETKLCVFQSFQESPHT